MKESTKLFIDVYNKLDKFLDPESNNNNYRSFSAKVDNSNNRVVRQYRKTLKSLGDLRNAIIHNHINDGKPIADPHIKTVELLNDIYNEVTKPKTVYDLFKKEVQGVNLEDPLKDLLLNINESSFSQFPVYDDKDKIVEIINTNTIARWLSAQLDDNGDLLILDTKVKNLIPFIEYSNNYKFIRRDATIYHAYDMFIDCIDNSKRNLDAVFVTHSGSESESILGLITVDDFAGKIDFNINWEL
jgi:predicted transcriptional regulator